MLDLSASPLQPGESIVQNRITSKFIQQVLVFDVLIPESGGRIYIGAFSFAKQSDSIYINAF